MTVTLSNHGCRLNAVEAEAMREMAAQAGLEDAVIVNTCAVTAEAVRKARRDVRRLRRERPGARVIVTGCAAQIEPETFAAMPEVDLVLGNHAKTRAATWAGLADDFGTERVRVEDIMSRCARPPGTCSRASARGPARTSRSRTAATTAAPSA